MESTSKVSMSMCVCVNKVNQIGEGLYYSFLKVSTFLIVCVLFGLIFPESFLWMLTDIKVEEKVFHHVKCSTRIFKWD